MNAEKMAKDIIEEVGGKENIVRMVHCVTRLRFTLADDTIPDRDKIKAMDGVAGLVEQGGQFQVIIGSNVDVVFEAAEKLLGKKENAAVEKKDYKIKKTNPVGALMGTVSQIFTPLLGSLTVCGVLLGLINLFTATGLLASDSPVYTILYSIANAFYYFMPILLGASSAERFGLNKYFGMVLGAALIHPNIIAETGTTVSLFGLPLTYQNYTSTVFPVIITVYFASLIHKPLNKVCPSQLKVFLPQLVTAVITIPVALIVIAPVVTVGGNLVSDAINALYSFSPVLCALALGGPWMVLVMFGLHWAVIPIMISNIATLGYDYTLGLLCAGQFAFATAAFAVGVRAKNAKKKELAFSTGVTCLLGVSEPCMYGVLIPEKKAFATAIIASSLASVAAGICGTKSYVLGGSGVFAFPSYISAEGIDRGFIGVIISVILALILGFVMTYFWGVSKETLEQQ